jgi:hypothetical protein
MSDWILLDKNGNITWDLLKAVSAETVQELPISPRLAEAQIRFPAIIGQPRFRHGMSPSGWWEVIRDQWFWPVRCLNVVSFIDCPACCGIPFWSKALQESIEKFLTSYPDSVTLEE